jgi:hypothetical protein
MLLTLMNRSANISFSHNEWSEPNAESVTWPLYKRMNVKLLACAQERIQLQNDNLNNQNAASKLHHNVGYEPMSTIYTAGTFSR